MLEKRISDEVKFFNACYDGNIDEVKEYLNLNLNFNYINPDPSTKDYPTAFAIACKNRHLAVVKILLNKIQIDVNPIIENGNTPFSKACFDSNMDLITLLLTNERVKINHSDNEGRTSFYIACCNGNTALVELLLSLDKIDINRQTNTLRSPLYAACENKHTDIITLLLKNTKLDVNAPLLDGRTPLHVACQRNFIDVVKLLLNDNRVDLTKQDNGEQTVLYIAFLRRRKELAEEILLKIFLQKPIFIFEEISEATLFKLLKPFGFFNLRLEIFQDEQAEIEIQKNLYLQFSASYLFVLIIFLCDDYLLKKPAFSEKALSILRFFSMAQKLPVELQMVLCYRAFGSMQDIVPKLEIEHFSRGLFEKYVQSRATLTALICEAVMLCKPRHENHKNSNRLIAYINAISKITPIKYDKIIMYAKELLENTSFCNEDTPNIDSFKKPLLAFIKRLKEALDYHSPLESKLAKLYDDNPGLFMNSKKNADKQSTTEKMQDIIATLESILNSKKPALILKIGK